MNSRWVKLWLAATGTLVAGTVFVAAPQAGAVSGTGSNQLVTFAPSAQLSIAASPASLGNNIAPAASVPVSLGSVVVTDTELDSTNWTASVAASDCFPATSTVAGAVLPATALTFNAGSPSNQISPTVPLASGTPAKATPGGSSTFGSAPAGGTLLSPTFSSPLTVASTNVTTFGSDVGNNDGVYTIAPALTLNLSSTGSFIAVPQTYTCTLQYTITG